MAHPLVQNPPYATLWQRGNRRDLGLTPLVHDELVVILGLSGTGRYLINGEDVRIRPGSMIWAGAGAAHMLVAAEHDFNIWVVLAATRLWQGSPLVPMQDVAGQEHGRWIAPEGQAELNALAAQTERLSGAARGLGLQWWLLRAHQLWSEAQAQNSPRYHRAVANAITLLAQDPKRSSPEIAKEAGLSQSQLSALFKAQTGQTLSAFRDKQKLLLADQSWAKGADLTHAALDAGFGSYTQFFRTFRKIRGLGPRAWYRSRKQF